MKSYKNQKFGFVTIISESYRKNGRTYAMCKCDCGNKKEMIVYNLTSGRVISCGNNCKYHSRENVIGKKFNFLTAIQPTRRQDGSAAWLFKCDCGKETVQSLFAVKRDIVKSCGCYQKQYMKNRGLNGGKDLSNQKFGLLTAIYPINGNEKESRKWKCLCECGNYCNVASGHLASGHTRSCGCVKSFGELQISMILNKNNIKYSKQYRVLIDNKTLFFDFLIENKYIIEFDGEQHFKHRENDFSWNTKENYNKVHSYDLLKNKYCFENGIQIIRIPFSKINNISIEDLLLESSKYILTEERQNEYYKLYS